MILILFEAVSGMHVNWSKNFIYPINEVPQIHSLVEIFGGKVGELHTIYLGMPLRAKCMSMGTWNGVLEKCEKKLSNWKSQHLSLWGRLILIESVLDALPTYMMSLFSMLANVADRIDAFRRNFVC